MTARDEAIEAGARALPGGTNYVMTGDNGFAGTMNRFTALFVLDAAEPIIRADERDRLRALLRDQREQFMRVTRTPPKHPMARIYDDVLALLDGGS